MAENNNIVESSHGDQINVDSDGELNRMMADCTSDRLGVSTEQSSPGFLCLPNELVLKIFGYLPQDTLHQLRLVNRVTNELSPPRCMKLRNMNQPDLSEYVANALNAPLDSVKHLRYVVFPLRE
ncbi:hypothetical protein PG994_003408 [Apiospora phragmitis]|uniref:F-box domain-containing protein n=1 Tax=Apiospora phragmitis TaxID=2905665 RepID=A0ABR1VXZ3_9PEZI